ncbi:hypothetical protein GE21DRAFT_4890 [Neurospora crassa]|uniref:Uncharacterized protein n=1 Tax=Neurospora crassa (strain ATCC 24698 / 74-OR23-1A / CBS 708.71 / DSM 1257 / FGSC 987) TaxID=367110 RepID=A7UXA7_NEUCR|nr:hypothetical protein NCU10429 [Neurospora crassa OR74A]EDO64939.1 hypothetical protein NCU10429 [Neurospora crassa OR74A]KHE81981.1 hypothetical protein GE21DRAFT_4890 [Neurospora crassa]|eukprot:XP_001728030.1 hypothetical protein NCU10429 [Neurospora crassa OR74A]
MALAVMSMNRDPARWTSVELAEHDVEKEVSESDNHTLGMTVLPLSRTASERVSAVRQQVESGYTGTPTSINQITHRHKWAMPLWALFASRPPSSRSDTPKWGPIDDTSRSHSLSKTRWLANASFPPKKQLGQGPMDQKEASS